MALQLATGFELDTTTIALESPNLTITGAPTIVTTPVNTGTYAMKITISGTGDGITYTQLSSSHSHYFKTSFYLQAAATSMGDIMSFVDASHGIVMAAIQLNTDNSLGLYYSDAVSGFDKIGSSSAPLSLNTWYDIELHIDDTGGAGATIIEARLNESVFATASNITEFTNSGMPNGQMLIGNLSIQPPTTSVFYFDDIVITDASGSFMTGYPGAIKLLRMTPNAAGDVNTFATQTGGTAGAGNNFTRVDETTPDGASTFNGSSTLNQEDLFSTPDPAVQSYDTVNFVQVLGNFRNSTADATATAKLEIEKAGSGTKAQGGAITPNSTTFKTTTPAQSLIAYQDPDGGVWTNLTLASSQLGYKLTTAPGTAGRRIDFSNVWGYIGYTPGTPPSAGLGSGNLSLLGVG